MIDYCKQDVNLFRTSLYELQSYSPIKSSNIKSSKMRDFLIYQINFDYTLKSLYYTRKF